MGRLERLFWRSTLAWWPDNVMGEDSDRAELRGQYRGEIIMQRRYRIYDTGGLGYLQACTSRLLDRASRIVQ